MKKVLQNVIYQILKKEDDTFGFPYPPLFQEKNVDYLCFTDSKRLTSKYWKIIFCKELDEKEILKKIESYEKEYELFSNQVLVGAVFEDSRDYEPVVTVPPFEELPGVTFDKSKMVSTKDEKGKYEYKKNPVYTGGKYDGREFLLTIGVPVSNQIETIDRCLSHIKPLLDKLDAELLVVDTGSSDGTIEVCKKYGARIVEFPWCDNMSAARNTAIYHAKGEWYLSIDDDEWFEDVDEILEFFRSGLYRQCDMATYIQRNYFYADKREIYADMPSLRMARIVPELHFEGRIHDALYSPKRDAIARIFSYANHNGFAKDDMNKVYEKYKRNTSILLYDVWEYPLDLRYRFQLANELFVSHNFSIAVAYFVSILSMGKEIKGIEYCRDSAVSLFSVLYNMMDQKRYFAFVKMLEQEYDFTSAERAFMAFVKADMALRFQYPAEEVLGYYCEWKKYKEEFERTPKEKRRHSFTGEHVCNNVPFITDAHVIGFCALCQLNRVEDAVKKLDEIALEHILNQEETFWNYLFTASEEIYQTAMKRMTKEVILAHQSLLWKVLLKDIDDARQRQRKISQLQWITEQYSVLELSEYLKNAVGLWDKSVQLALCDMSSEISEEILSIQIAFFFGTILQYNLSDKNRKQHREYFEQFIRMMGYFSRHYYSEFVLEEDSNHAIADVVRAAYFIDRSKSEERMMSQRVAYLKRALAQFPGFKSEIEQLLEELAIQQESKEAHSQQLQSEMDNLYQRLIQQADVLLQNGKVCEAKKILEELYQIFPQNTELKQIIEAF